MAVTFLDLLKIQCRVFSVSQIKEDIFTFKNLRGKYLFISQGKMTYLQNTGICWYANKITEVSFFILHHKKGDPSKKPLSGSKQKLILKLLTYILRQLGFILCI